MKLSNVTHLPMTLALALSLGVCGSGQAEEEDTEMVLPAQAAVPSLFDDEGLSQPPLPAAVPPSVDELTRNGRYALRAQAEALDRAFAGSVIWVDVDCCNEHAVETALGTVDGLAAANDLGPTVPVFVTGRDLRIAAAAADRLGVHGYTRVFLVTD